MKYFKQLVRTSLVLLIAVTFGTSSILAQEYEYRNSWGKHGFQLNDQKSSGVEINYSIQSFTLSKERINKESLDILSLPGTFLPNDEGAPNLPGMGRFIAIPNGATASFEITNVRKETFENIEMAPAPRIPWETEVGPLDYEKNSEIYQKDAFYPENPVLLSEVTEIRGVKVVTLGITPFQYNPVTKQLIVYRDLEVKIDFTGGNGEFGQERLRSRWWDPIMEDIFLNYSSLPKVDYNKSFTATDDVGCDYLILTPTGDEFLQWADSIKAFRTAQGIRTDVVTVVDAGGNNIASLEAYFDGAYNEWDIVPSAVLILGDYGSGMTSNITAPVWAGYCVSDNIWADVTDNDMPDIVFARMTAQDETDLETMVTKFLEYERSPPTNPDFYQNPISALGFQTARWFQICSESVAGFWDNELGKTTNRINKTYAGYPSSDPWSTATNTSTVLGVFGPDGLGYLPAMPGDVDCSWDGNAQDVVSGINNGAFMIQHRDHGLETGWGEPEFYNSDIENLENTDLTFIWSINCLTGKYNIAGECFTEKFHRYKYNGENSGALGLNAASEVSYSFVNDTYVWGAYDNMWPNFLPDYGATPSERGVLPAFGCAAGKYFLEQSSWPYNTVNKEVTYNLFHHHGDAFTTVYTVVPTDLTVDHLPFLYAGITSYEITANEGALIALTVNGEIIATAEGEGVPVSINIPGQDTVNTLLVTITLQDYYRYEKTVEIVSPEGSYVVQSGIELNDESGNGNGVMETGELIFGSLTVENVGIEDAENINVTLLSDDEYVTILDDSEDYGTIPSGEEKFLENGFSWEVAEDIPDQHTVFFEVISSDGNESWSTNLVIKGHAPVLEIGEMTINDDNGNGNGRLDPGEDAFILFETINTGSYDAMNAIGNLVIASSYVTVNNSNYDFEVLESGIMQQAVFNISISDEAPIGVPAAIIYEVNSGGYNEIISSGITIGLIVEDWETGDMTSFDWETGGDAEWSVISSDSYEGSHSLKSQNIDDSEETWIKMELEVFADDIISFARKVSSEGSYDYLRFYIDGTEKGSWSGSKAWDEEEFPISTGVHTLMWKFEKDNMVTSGQDCAWIDFIILPAPPVTTAYAGVDDATCENSPFQTDGIATLYNAVAWTSSGTGAFDDFQALEPIYTPSNDDIVAGSVTLTFTAYHPDTEVSDDMVLTMDAAPTAFAGENILSCSDVPFSLMEASAQNQASVTWTSSGDGSFNDNQIVNPIYLPGEDDAANGMVILTFTALGNNTCDDAIDEIEVTLVAAAIASAGEDAVACTGQAYLFETASAENFSSIQWATTGDGSFDDLSLMNPSYFPGTEDLMNGEVSIIMTVFGYDGCSDATAQTNLTIEQGPEVYAGEDNAILPGSSYIIQDATVENQNSLLWTSSGDGSFDDATVINATYNPGSIDIETKEVTLTLTAEGNVLCGESVDQMMLSINTGIGENNQGMQVRVYPNPNAGNFALELKGNHKENVNIYIYNTLGDVVYKQENVEVSGSYTENLLLDVEHGMYLIRIEGDQLLINQKIMIQK